MRDALVPLLANHRLDHLGRSGAWANTHALGEVLELGVCDPHLVGEIELLEDAGAALGLLPNFPFEKGAHRLRAFHAKAPLTLTH